MYNAFVSWTVPLSRLVLISIQTSFEGPGGQGSTRLHMDMADAVNIMMYASDCADGSPGVAAWDIFRASDSEKIRSYLRRHFQDKATEYRDPIHSQLFYLDSDHRKKLYEEEKVYSWRIYQRPGEAVFIPAGCAHQVCY
jgi:lysine-specific demethylase 3